MTEKPIRRPRAVTADALAEIMWRLDLLEPMQERLARVEAQSGLLLDTLPILPPAAPMLLTEQEREELAERLLREVMAGVDSRVMAQCAPLIVKMAQYLDATSAATAKAMAEQVAKLAECEDQAEASIRRTETHAREAIRAVQEDGQVKLQKAVEEGRSALSDVYTGTAEAKAVLLENTNREVQELTSSAKAEIEQLGQAAREVMGEALSEASDGATAAIEILSRTAQRHEEMAAKMASAERAFGKTVSTLEASLEHLSHYGPALARNEERRMNRLAAKVGLVSAGATSFGMMIAVWLAHVLQVRV